MERDEPSDTSDTAASFRAAAQGYRLAMEIIAALVTVFVFPAGGAWLDRQWQTVPLWLFVGLFVGCVSGGLQLWRVARTVAQSAARSSAPNTDS